MLRPPASRLAFGGEWGHQLVHLLHRLRWRSSLALARVSGGLGVLQSAGVFAQSVSKTEPSAEGALTALSGLSLAAENTAWAWGLGLGVGLMVAWVAFLRWRRLATSSAMGSSGAFGVQAREVYTSKRARLAAHFFHRQPQTAATVTMPFLKPYNPKNVGNDASARPWESPEREHILGGMAALEVSTDPAPHDFSVWGTHPVAPTWSDLEPPDLPQAWREGLPIASQTWSRFDTASAAQTRTRARLSPAELSCPWPFEFEVADFLKMAQKHFLALQEAWDRRDLAQMQDFLSPSMLHDVQDQFATMTTLESHRHASDMSQVMSEVLMLESQCLSVKREGLEQKVSVELSGMIREGLNASPNPFREIWTWSKTLRPHMDNDLQGWRVCALEALQ